MASSFEGPEKGGTAAGPKAATGKHHRRRGFLGLRFFIAIVSTAAILLLALVAIERQRAPAAGRFEVRPGEDEEKLVQQRKEQLIQKLTVDLTAKPSVLIVTAIPRNCLGLSAARVAQLMKNRIDYARKHQMHVHFALADYDPELIGTWHKIAVLRKALQTQTQYEWVWWLGHEALIADMGFRFPWKKYRNANLVFGPSKSWFLFNEPGHDNIDTGVFLLRSCRWSLDLLDRVVATGRAANQEGTELWGWLRETVKDMPAVTDQAVLVYHLFQERAEMEKLVMFEAFTFGGPPGAWKEAAGALRELDGSRLRVGDGKSPAFVIHFGGCDLCGGAHDGDLCGRSFETTFNFADNQVLEELHLQHGDLMSQFVQEMPQAGYRR